MTVLFCISMCSEAAFQPVVVFEYGDCVGYFWRGCRNKGVLFTGGKAAESGVMMICDNVGDNHIDYFCKFSRGRKKGQNGAHAVFLRQFTSVVAHASTEWQLLTRMME